MRRRGYHLRSVWRLPAAPERCWEVLADPAMTRPTWWPGMSAHGVHVSPDGSLGSRARLRFRSPLGYSLAVHLTVTGIDPGRCATLAVTGDLEGRAQVQVEADGRPGTTLVRVLWDVRTVRPWMNLTGPVLAPVFARAHAHVMAAGERGLTRHLTGGDATSPAP
ncbi:SRPBCC family protein [Cellulomonas soli]|uniref:SRPBCC family protein n=1 Tax=Cellulomonas soli TaxID=931535 RepID=UPI003F871A71